MSLRYARETSLSAAEYITCVGQTELGKSRPLANAPRVQAMLDESDLIVTARDSSGTLLGVSRIITDWHWVAYCIDLAVVEGQQGQGIGRELMEQAVALLGPKVGLALLPLPNAEAFYRRIGMQEYPAFWRSRADKA
jgi:GNAT superfamily N-acetyltransferase